MIEKNKLHPITRFTILASMVWSWFIISARPAFAQDPAADMVTLLSDILIILTGVVQALTVIGAILGLTMWGFGKIAKPLFPGLSSLFNGEYVKSIIIDETIVFLASTIVRFLATSTNFL